MKGIFKKKFCSACQIFDNSILSEIHFDQPFDGKVIISLKKDDKGAWLLCLEVDGHEYF